MPDIFIAYLIFLAYFVVTVCTFSLIGWLAKKCQSKYKANKYAGKHVYFIQKDRKIY